MKNIFLLCILALTRSLTLTAQQDPFNVQAYEHFLQQNKDLQTGKLLAQYPAPIFKARTTSNPLSASFLDSVRKKYNLTSDELSLLSNNGFVVTERLSYESIGDAMKDIFHKDLPLFITTDAILHALHKSYDDVLRATEISYLNGLLEKSLENLHASWTTLQHKYGSNPSMQTMLNDVDIYLTVARKLVGQSAAPKRFENASIVNEIMSYIRQEQPASIALFSSSQRLYDFSQLKPRGHYTDDQTLREYFQAMMWIGRTEFMLLRPEGVVIPAPSDEDIRRQVIDATLLCEAAKNDSTYETLSEIDRIMKYLVGESDNVTLDNLHTLRMEWGIQDATALLDENAFSDFQNRLKTKAFAFQRINSQILLSSPFDPTKITPPAAFLLLGQRFVIDSYVTGNVVYDKIEFQGSEVFRALPSGLDPLFALGNDASAQLLRTELERYHYGSNLAGLRYLIDSYDEDFWGSTLYNVWLRAIRTLNPPKNISHFPSFMQTGAWWQEKINTQLASWAQLRHDNLLYAKQSYTGGATCNYPHTYIEPYPDFYLAIGSFAKKAFTEFSKVKQLNGIAGFFDSMMNTMAFLESIAQKEIDGLPLSEIEVKFLKETLVRGGVCGPEFYGWYPNLFYSKNFDNRDFIVADVHTAPTDASGNMVGWVLHAGTGNVNLGIITAPAEDGTLTAFVGPMLSYYEHVTTNFFRLTDQEWEKMYFAPSVVRPSWVNNYLADKEGKQRQPGSALITEGLTTINGEKGSQPTRTSLADNFPNPFGEASANKKSETHIRFSVESQEEIFVELSIFDIAGRKVRTLIKQNLSAGNFIATWDGRNDARNSVGSGVYFTRLTSGNTASTKKIILMR